MTSLAEDEAMPVEPVSNVDTPDVVIGAREKQEYPIVSRELVPPSRRKNLPKNLVVTSVDVESDEWIIGNLNDFGLDYGPQEEKLSSPEEAAEVNTLAVPACRVPDSPEIPASHGNSKDVATVQKMLEEGYYDANWGSFEHVDISRLQPGTLVATQVRRLSTSCRFQYNFI